MNPITVASEDALSDALDDVPGLADDLSPSAPGLQLVKEGGSGSTSSTREAGGEAGAPLDWGALEEKVIEVFGDLSIDKRRLPASKLNSRGVPA